MKIMVADLQGYSDQRIILNFSGVLSTGENVSLNASYNEEGKLTNCSAAYSSCNCPDYYIGIAAYFQKMKDAQGEPVLNLIKQIDGKLQPIREQIFNVDDEMRPLANRRRELLEDKRQISLTLKRLRKQERIDECNTRLNEIDGELNTIDVKYSELDKKMDKLYDECRKAKRVEVTL